MGKPITKKDAAVFFQEFSRVFLWFSMGFLGFVWSLFFVSLQMFFSTNGKLTIMNRTRYSIALPAWAVNTFWVLSLFREFVWMMFDLCFFESSPRVLYNAQTFFIGCFVRSS